MTWARFCYTWVGFLLWKVNSELYLEMPDPHTKLWRYIDFPKFVDVLLNGSLFFSQEKNFEDPSEGWRHDCFPPGSPIRESIAPLYDDPRYSRDIVLLSHCSKEI